MKAQQANPIPGSRRGPFPTFRWLIEMLGRRTEARLEATGRFAGFVRECIIGCVFPPWRPSLIAQHCIQLGIRAMPVAMLTALFVGMVIVLQAGEQLRAFNATYLAAGGSAKALFQGMIPIFTALVVGARMSASIAAELGTMRVTEQIDALEILDVPPKAYLIWPRVIAATIMLPVITIYADVIGMAGGIMVGLSVHHISYQQWMNVTYEYLVISDVVIGLSKTFFFGAAMGVCGCYFGYYTRGGAEGVGRATTKAVVYTLTSLVVIEYLLTNWSLYILQIVENQ